MITNSPYSPYLEGLAGRMLFLPLLLTTFDQPVQSECLHVINYDRLLTGGVHQLTWIITNLYSATIRADFPGAMS